MRALQRLGIIAIAVGTVVGTAWSAAKANPALLEERGILTSGDALLDDGSLYDQHVFSGSSGQQVTIYLESDDFDPYLILLDPDRRRISENDDISRTNRNSRLVITLPTSGSYTVVANSYEAGKTGNYRIKVNGEGTASTSRSFAREMAMTAVPNGTPVCSTAMVSALDTLYEGREVDVLVDAVQLSQRFETVPANRSNGVSMGLSGPAALSVMFSPQFLTRLSSGVIRDCTTVGAVVFEATEAGFDRTFGYLPRQAAVDSNEVPVDEFGCAGLSEADTSELPEWGDQMCL